MEYPSTKRMKKRRELDALVADKKKPSLKSPGSSLPDRLLKSSLIKPMVIKTRGDHQLLRSQDSESENEFVSFNRTDHTSALVPSNQKTQQKLLQQQHRQSLKQSVHNHDDDDDFSFREDADLEDISGRRRRSCCGDPASSKQRPLFHCSRCCAVAMLAVCIVGMAALAWMNLGLKREIQTLESRFLRFSLGYTKIPPRIDSVETSVGESEKNLEELEKLTLPEINASILAIRNRVQSINESFDALARKNANPAPTKREFLRLQSEWLRLKNGFKSAADDLKLTKEKMTENRKNINLLIAANETMAAAFRNDERVGVRIGKLETVAAGLKAKLMEVEKEIEEENEEESNGETVIDETKPGLRNEPNSEK